MKIERGEANTTLEVIEKLCDAMDWDPLQIIDGARESVTESIRQLLIAEFEKEKECTDVVLSWLSALNPCRTSAGSPNAVGGLSASHRVPPYRRQFPRQAI